MRLLLLDNYDSFVFNLAQAFGAAGAEPLVVRNHIPVAELLALNPDAVVISPGPGHPTDAGCSVEATRAFAGRVAVLGVCLGHQAIGVAFGGHVDRAPAGPVHGKTSVITHSGDDALFAGISQRFEATRYHSLAIDEVPQDLAVTARSADATVMAVRHRTMPVYGVQFHPESVLSPDGPRLLANFLAVAADTLARSG